MDQARLRVLSFESRRAAEMRSLIERAGASAIVAPSMREVPLESNGPAFAFAESLLAGRIDVVVFLTGVGARTLLEAVETRFDREQFLAALRSVTVAVRGPKPVAVLREWNVPFAIRRRSRIPGASSSQRSRRRERCRVNASPFRNTAGRTKSSTANWLGRSDSRASPRLSLDAAGRCRTLAGGRARHDRRSVRRARIHECPPGRQRAGSCGVDGTAEAWIAAAGRCAVASIGPTASESIAEAGLPVDIEASPTKMGQLVRAAIEAAPAILSAKRAGTPQTEPAPRIQPEPRAC